MSGASPPGGAARPSPFPGLSPFRYELSPVFFERRGETRSLLRLITIYRGVLLYADSGIGKSSLINAGLVPRAFEEGFQPYAVKLQPRLKEEFLLTCVPEQSASIPGTWRPASRTPETIAADGLGDWVRTTEACGPSSLVPLVILDQFEEAVTLFEDGPGNHSEGTGTGRQAQARIFDALVSLINDPMLPVKLLLSFREDFLAKMTPLLRRCPGLSDHYLRLEPLQTNQVSKLVRGPFDAFPGVYTPEIPAEMAQTIENQFAARSTDGLINPSELQIVCQTLYERSADHDQLIKSFADFGGAKGILEDYFYSSVMALGDDTGPAIGLLARLVTSAGTRNVVSLDDLLARVAEDGYSTDALLRTLDLLDKHGLVRRERRRNVYFYEIVSEFLIDPINETAREYMAWKTALPFGHFIDLVTGDVHRLVGDHALVGRGIPAELHSRINFTPRFVSRVHLLVLRSRHIFDARSTNGTTLNASPLNPEDLRKMEDGDIVVLANTVILRFQAGTKLRSDPVLSPAIDDPQTRGMFVNGKARSVTPLPSADYYLEADPDTGLWLGAEPGRKSIAHLVIPSAGKFSLELMRDDIELVVYYKGSNFGYLDGRLQSGNRLDPAGLDFSWDGHPFQIVALDKAQSDDADKQNSEPQSK